MLVWQIALQKNSLSQIIGVGQKMCQHRKLLHFSVILSSALMGYSISNKMWMLYHADGDKNSVQY